MCEYPDGTKSLKLGDFGLATVVEGPLYTVCGTPTYVAPEIIAETGYASWGVGLVLELWEQAYMPRLLLWIYVPPWNMGGGRGLSLHRDFDTRSSSLCLYFQEPWAWTSVPRPVLESR